MAAGITDTRPTQRAAPSSVLSLHCVRAMKEQSPPSLITENISAILDLERKSLASSSWSARVSDTITRFAGTLWFVACHLVLFGGWALWNAMAPGPLRFDPYPYGLLTFFVSMEGVLIVTFVLIAQNRMSAQSDRRDHLDLQVDLLAEQEMTMMLGMLRKIMARLDIDADGTEASKAARLGEQTNVYELMHELEKQLPDSSPGHPE
jgi:uncharacterized membrane protein